MVQGSIASVTVLALAMFMAKWVWPLELPTNFRPQLFLGAVVLFVLAVVWGSKRDALFGLVPVTLLAIAVIPLYIGGPERLAEGADGIRVLQFNVQFTNDNYDGIVDEVVSSGADIVTLHEVTPTHWDQVGDRLLAEYPHMLFSPASVGGIHTDQVMLSRTPLELAEVETDFRNPPFAVTTELGGREVLAVALHTHPSRTNREFIADRHAEVDAAVAAVRQHDLPAIIITDLNVTPTSPEYGALLDDLGWRNPRRGLGLTPTWSPPVPVLGPFFGVAIDHVLASPELTVHSYDLGDGAGSDHRSLLATLSFS